MMRVARADEIGTVLDWAAAEGWNPGLDDAAAFFAADPEGFFVTERDGAPVAAISVVNHAPDMAFLGLYLCRPEWRGQGIGFALWQHAL
ncbi:MAG: GNAT family N-acetyltransferase, partial [Maritimibacter sp.]|nr:GNAT family N-acetyltransferase [Maritimibacter sp.]